MKDNYSQAFAAVVIGSVLMVAVALAAKTQAKPAPDIEISLGQSKTAVYKAIGKPDFSVLGGRLGSESETYFVMGLNVSYRDSRVAVLTVRKFERPEGIVVPKGDKSQQTVVTLK